MCSHLGLILLCSASSLHSACFPSAWDSLSPVLCLFVFLKFGLRFDQHFQNDRPFCTPSVFCLPFLLVTIFLKKRVSLFFYF